MDIICYKCKKQLSLPESKIPFRFSCDYCLSDLHVCKNCTYYAVGQPNDCRVPGTEFVSDREKANFCEEFRLKDQKNSSDDKKSLHEVADHLFGPSKEPHDNNKTFEDFFKKP